MGAGRAGVRDRETLSHVLDKLSVIQPPTRVGFPIPDTSEKKVLTASCHPDLKLDFSSRSDREMQFLIDEQQIEVSFQLDGLN
jgi:hypothetical protein